MLFPKLAGSTAKTPSRSFEQVDLLSKLSASIFGKTSRHLSTNYFSKLSTHKNRVRLTRSPCFGSAACVKPSDWCECWCKLSKLTNHGVYQELVYQNEVQWNLDLTKCQGTGEIGSLYRGSFPYITLLLGWKISFVIPRTSLYRGSLNRGSNAYRLPRLVSPQPPRVFRTNMFSQSALPTILEPGTG